MGLRTEFASTRGWTDASGRWKAEGEMIRLTLGRMFEATVRDCSNEFVLEQEVAETGRMDANVTALLVGACIIRGKAALCSAGGAVGGRLGGLDFLVGVVDEVFFVRHDENKMSRVWASLCKRMMARES